MKSVPNGCLKLGLPHGGRVSWSEGPRGPIERKLPGFFAEIERRAVEDDRRAEERARQEELRRQEERERLERQRLAQIETMRAERLSKEVTAWRLAADARAYVNALRQRLEELQAEDRQRIKQWCDWADTWIRRSDPVTNPRVVEGVETQPDPRHR